MKKKNYYWKETFLTMLFLLSFCAYNLYAQESIKGQVKDNLEIPLPGVTIVVEGTTNGVAADIDGNFIINASQGDVLSFSYIGFKTKKVTVGASKTLSVILEEDTEALEEVVVVGYGSQKKKEVTGAVVGIKSDLITKAPVADVAASIQGSVAGVNVQASSGRPGAASNIQIRGVSLGNNPPLYVVDGIPYEGVPNIAPEQIEKLDILKDGASAAIYGVRASNGVILITTKRGKKGKLEIELSSYAGVQNITSGINILNSTDQFLVETVATKAVNSAPFLYGFNPQGLNNDSDFVGDVQDNNALLRNYAIAINGGSDEFTVSFNTNYYDQEGVLINSGFDRLSSRLNATYNKGRFKAFASVGITYENRQQEPWALYELALRQRPWQVSFADVERLDDNNVVLRVNNAIQYAYISQLLSDQDERVVNSYNAAFNMQYEISPGLNYKINLGRNNWNYRRKLFQPQYLVTDLTGDINVSASRLDSRVSEQFQFTQRDIIENILTYGKNFGNHNINLTAVNSYEHFTSKQVGMGIFGLLSNSVNGLGAGRETLPATSRDEVSSLSGLLGRIQYNYDGKYLISASIRRDGTSRFSEENRYGVFKGISAGWNISDENFMKNADTQINSLKLRASWAELGNQDTPNYGIYSQINQGVNYPFGVNEENSFGSIQRGLANTNQVWETKISRNIGLDLAMFENRLTFSADLYKNNRINMILLRELPNSFGTRAPRTNFFSSLPVNAGDMENKGIELALGFRSRPEKEFSWDVAATWTMNENKILDLNDIERGFEGGRPSNFNPAATAPTTFNAVGYEAGAFFLKENLGVIKTQDELTEYKLIDSNAELGDLRFKDQINIDTDGDGVADAGDGKINEADRVYAGSGQAEWEAGLNLNFGYKNWDLYIQNYFSYGAEIFNGAKYLAYNTGRHQDQYFQWSPQNPNTDIPTYRLPDSHPNKSADHDFWIEDGTYFRIRNISLGYTIPSKVMEKSGISKLRFYLSALNPITFTNYSGFDPEVGGNGLSSRGVDSGNYPVARRFLLGLQVKF